MLAHHPEPQGQPFPTDNTVWDRHLLPADLAAELRHARHALRLGLREVARAAGISPGYLSRLERAERCPRVPVAVRLARVLDLDDDLTDAFIEAAVDPYEPAIR
jgi:transcriptional regulator with XRE-family HTH domain